MTTRFNEEEDCVPPLFRPFTRESLAAIQARIAEENARKAAQLEVCPFNHYFVTKAQKLLLFNPFNVVNAVRNSDQ